jgi:hypothetical protein
MSHARAKRGSPRTGSKGTCACAVKTRKLYGQDHEQSNQFGVSPHLGVAIGRLDRNAATKSLELALPLPRHEVGHLHILYGRRAIAGAVVDRQVCFPGAVVILLS